MEAERGLEGNHKIKRFKDNVYLNTKLDLADKEYKNTLNSGLAVKDPTLNVPVRGMTEE